MWQSRHRPIAKQCGCLATWLAWRRRFAFDTFVATPRVIRDWDLNWIVDAGMDPQWPRVAHRGCGRARANANLLRVCQATNKQKEMISTLLLLVLRASSNPCQAAAAEDLTGPPASSDHRNLGNLGRFSILHYRAFGWVHNAGGGLKT